MWRTKDVRICIHRHIHTHLCMSTRHHGQSNNANVMSRHDSTNIRRKCKGAVLSPPESLFMSCADNRTHLAYLGAVRIDDVATKMVMISFRKKNDSCLLVYFCQILAKALREIFVKSLSFVTLKHITSVHCTYVVFVFNDELNEQMKKC